MEIKLTDFYTNCPSCGKALQKNDPKACHAEINIGDQIRNYVFCNYNHLAEKMEKINPPVPDGQFEFEIKLDVKEKVGTNPEKWLLIYSVIEPKFELLTK